MCNSISPSISTLKNTFQFMLSVEYGGLSWKPFFFNDGWKLKCFIVFATLDLIIILGSLYHLIHIFYVECSKERQIFFIESIEKNTKQYMIPQSMQNRELLSSKNLESVSMGQVQGQGKILQSSRNLTPLEKNKMKPVETWRQYTFAPKVSTITQYSIDSYFVTTVNSLLFFPLACAMHVTFKGFV